MDDDLASLVEELVRGHCCHTIILYGSRARGDATPESDYDLLGIREHAERAVDLRPHREGFLDAWIYPSGEVKADKAFLHLRGGRVLLDRDGMGARLLAELDEVYKRGPAPLSDSERVLRQSWPRKMLTRISARKNEPEAGYRRAWLLVDLLPAYFELRQKWYLGSKESFRWLAEHDAETHALFAAALDGTGGDGQLLALVERCVTVG
jgi:uncharacterized protein